MSIQSNPRSSSERHDKEKTSFQPPRKAKFLSGVWVVVVSAVIAAAGFLWVRSAQLPMLRGAHGYVMADPDCYIRWHLVKQALDGEGVRIRWLTVDNAPYGRINEWTAPMTIIGVTVVRLTEWIGGLPREEAFKWWGLWLGPVLGLAGLGMLGWLGWRAGGWLLAVCWLLAWPAVGTGSPPNQFCNQFGSVDHHSLHQLLFICMVGGCLARIRGIFIGLLSALAMWSGGSELLPAWGLIAGLAVWETGWRSENVRFWREWWISGLLGTTAAWVIEFWPNLFHGHLEFISIWHVGLWCLCGGLVEFLARSRVGPAAKIGAVLLAMLLAIVGAGAMKQFHWSHLHVVQDALFQRQIADTLEFRSLFSDGLGPALARFAANYGLLVLMLLLAVGNGSRLSVRVKWALVVTLLLLALTAREERWGDFFAAAVVMTAGAVLAGAMGQAAVDLRVPDGVGDIAAVVAGSGDSCGSPEARRPPNQWVVRNCNGHGGCVRVLRRCG